MSYSLYFIDKKITLSDEHGSWSQPVKIEGHDWNATGTNTGAVLFALGFPFENGDSGEIQVRELWAATGRFLQSEMAVVVDGGKATVQTGNWIEGGRREGYLVEKITIIRAHCEAAMTLNATHAYFA